MVKRKKIDDKKISQSESPNVNINKATIGTMNSSTISIDHNENNNVNKNDKNDKKIQLLYFYNNIIQLMFNENEYKQMKYDSELFSNKLDRLYVHIMSNNGINDLSHIKNYRNRKFKTWRNLKHYYLDKIFIHDLNKLSDNNENNNSIDSDDNNESINDIVNSNENIDDNANNKSKKVDNQSSSNNKKKLSPLSNENDDDLGMNSWASTKDRPKRLCTLRNSPSNINKNPYSLSPMKNVGLKKDKNEKSTVNNNHNNEKSKILKSSSGDASKLPLSSKDVEQMIINCNPNNFISTMNADISNNHHQKMKISSNCKTNMVNSEQPPTSNVTVIRPVILRKSIDKNTINQQTQKIVCGQTTNSGTVRPYPNIKAKISLPSASTPSSSKTNGTFSGKILLLNSKPIIVQKDGKLQIPMIRNIPFSIAKPASSPTTAATSSAVTFKAGNSQSINNHKKSSNTLPSEKSIPEVIKIEDDSEDEIINVPDNDRSQISKSNENNSKTYPVKLNATNKKLIIKSSNSNKINGQLANVSMETMHINGFVSTITPPSTSSIQSIDKITNNEQTSRIYIPQIVDNNCAISDDSDSAYVLRKAKKAEYMRRYRQKLRESKELFNIDDLD